MKKWLILLLLSLTLVACSDDKEIDGLKVEKLDEVNDDVQTIIDMTADNKFASVIYSEAATSYLLLNATGDVEVTFTPDGSNLNINIEHKKDEATDKTTDIAYSFYLDQPYDKIHVFENGEEIPIEVWIE